MEERAKVGKEEHVKKVNICYDEEGDILEILFGEPQEEISEELDDDVVLHKNFEGEIVGLTILNFKKRFKQITKL
ncbi:MAG: DUF2283 domain-containing protein [Candidatus Methanospirare jalkutatii]|nr:DUF2283 domain-containing protein [Candidatus Methanospirare jalkutatii]